MLYFAYNRAASGGVTSTPRKPNHNSRQRAFMAEHDLTPFGESPQLYADTEFWKRVPSEPGVHASSHGRILLAPGYAPLPNGGFRTYLPEPRVGQVAKSSKTAKHEFMLIMVRRDDGRTRQAPRKVHQLVCEAFHGPKPFDGAVVIHIDENALNNRADNLRWETQKENLNMPKFKKYCRSRVGENSPFTKGKARKAS
jgi:hypothetical protein